jgi:hypothetical protein
MLLLITLKQMNNKIRNTTRNSLWRSSQNPVQIIVWHSINSINSLLWSNVGHFIQNRIIHSVQNTVMQCTQDYFKENE